MHLTTEKESCYSSDFGFIYKEHGKYRKNFRHKGNSECYQ